MTSTTTPGITAAALPAGWHNPLRDKRDKRMPRIAGPCSVVIFGVTGDLARKKLMPAIYDLANRGLLPPSFSLVGFARRDWADQDFGKIVVHGHTPGHTPEEHKNRIAIDTGAFMTGRLTAVALEGSRRRFLYGQKTLG